MDNQIDYSTENTDYNCSLVMNAYLLTVLLLKNRSDGR